MPKIHLPLKISFAKFSLYIAKLVKYKTNKIITMSAMTFENTFFILFIQKAPIGRSCDLI